MHHSLIFLYSLLFCLFIKQSEELLHFNKRNQVKLCPIEYQSCMCNYTSASRFNSRPEHIEYSSQHTLSVFVDCRKNKQLANIPKVHYNQNNRNSLQHITQIDLSRTSIKTVQTDAFQGLIGLKTIIITYCEELKQIQMFAFRNLLNLKTLIISNNPNLVNLEPHALGSLRNLNYLSLSMNNLRVIDGYVFSSSTSIKRISFIGNPIKRIKSHAFHGLKNVTDLMISFNQNVAPIDVIEGDAFISLAFVDQIFLDGIPARSLLTNTFRGLSYCKTLHLSNTYIEKIHANAFFRTNHIQLLNLKNSRVRSLHRDAFSNMFSIDTIDLSGNYISKLAPSIFEHLKKVDDSNLVSPNVINKSEITIIDERKKLKNTLVNKILLEQNPIQCDCNLAWLLKNKANRNFISLPEICAGPKGFDCLRVGELSLEKLACPKYNQNFSSNAPCQDLEFSYNKTQSQIVNEIFSIQKPDGEKQFIDKFVEDNDSSDYYYDGDDYEYYYTVENVRTDDLNSIYTSTPANRPRKKSTKPMARSNESGDTASGKNSKTSSRQAKERKSGEADKILTLTNSANSPSFTSYSMIIKCTSSYSKIVALSFIFVISLVFA